MKRTIIILFCLNCLFLTMLFAAPQEPLLIQGDGTNIFLLTNNNVGRDAIVINHGEDDIGRFKIYSSRRESGQSTSLIEGYTKSNVQLTFQQGMGLSPNMGQMIFYTRPENGDLTERMRITDIGDVSISSNLVVNENIILKGNDIGNRLDEIKKELLEVGNEFKKQRETMERHDRKNRNLIVLVMFLFLIWNFFPSFRFIIRYSVLGTFCVYCLLQFVKF